MDPQRSVTNLKSLLLKAENELNKLSTYFNSQKLTPAPATLSTTPPDGKTEIIPQKKDKITWVSPRQTVPKRKFAEVFEESEGPEEVSD